MSGDVYTHFDEHGPVMDLVPAAVARAVSEEGRVVSVDGALVRSVLDPDWRTRGADPMRRLRIIGTGDGRTGVCALRLWRTEAAVLQDLGGGRPMRAPGRDGEAGDLSAAARRYAVEGWSVVPVHSVRDGTCSCGREPCPSVAKHPRVRWEHAMEEPADVRQIERWWRRWPDANVGVVTGVVSGIAVLDVDPRNGGDATLRDLEAAYDVLPVTPEVRTGGGGSHLWFAAQHAVASGTLGPGLEVKGEGGLVVAPPSVHASGHRYEWRPRGSPDDLDLAQAPGWFAASPGGRLPGEDRHHDLPAHLRTDAERAAFAASWAESGIDLGAGDRYYLCPFHDDHHPSLHIDAEGCRWYCFGCGRGGGIGSLRRMLGEPGAAVPRARLRTRPGRGLPVTLHGRHEVEVVGESHHQDELLELTGGTRRFGGVDVETVAELTPEPDNRFDPAAVAVRIADRTVGYVGREDVEWLRPLIDDSMDLHRLVTCRAVVRGGWDRGRGDVGLFGVTLLVPDPSQTG